MTIIPDRARMWQWANVLGGARPGNLAFTPGNPEGDRFQELKSALLAGKLETEHRDDDALRNCVISDTALKAYYSQLPKGQQPRVLFPDRRTTRKSVDPKKIAGYMITLLKKDPALTAKEVQRLAQGHFNALRECVREAYADHVPHRSRGRPSKKIAQ